MTDKKHARNEAGSEGREGMSPSRKAVGKLLGLVSVVALAGILYHEKDEANQRHVGMVEAQEAVEQHRVVGIRNDVLFARKGVNVRTDPNIKKDSGEDRGNIDYKVGEGKVLVIQNGVEITNKDDEPFIAFSDSSGQVGYLSPDVLRQKNDKGESYVISQPVDDITEYNPDQISFDPESGQFFADGVRLGQSELLNTDDAFEALAGLSD